MFSALQALGLSRRQHFSPLSLSLGALQALVFAMYAPLKALTQRFHLALVCYMQLFMHALRARFPFPAHLWLHLPIFLLMVL